MSDSDDTTLSSLGSSHFADEIDEENVALPANRVRRPKLLRNRSNPFEIFDDFDFKARFRFNKVTVMALLHKFGHHLEPLNRRNRPISSINQLLIALRFYATGSFQAIIGDTFNIHK